jgi:hypothetical protein
MGTPADLALSERGQGERVAVHKSGAERAHQRPYEAVGKTITVLLAVGSTDPDADRELDRVHHTPVI